MNKIRKGDEVIVSAGKDKGRRGTVLQVFDDGRVLVEGINMVKKHMKKTNDGQGGIVETAMPLDISNVMVFNLSAGKGERVGFQVGEDGNKVRVFRGSGDLVDQ
ncbi:MAG: 50S ribosomal protein L24 [Pseudomonadota bacterium]